MFGRKSILILVMIAALLVAGCLGTQTQGNTQTGANPTGAAPSGTTPQNGTAPSGGTPSNNGGTPAGTGTTAPPANTGGSTGGGLNDLVGKTWDQLSALGIPMQCDITTTSNGETTNARIYAQGKDNVRSEVAISQSGSTCTRMVSVMKGNTAYIGCMEGSMFPDTGDASNPLAGCAWLQMSVNTSSSGGTSPNSPPGYSDVPASQINCQPWIYDASKFTISGKVCNLDNLGGN